LRNGSAPDKGRKRSIVCLCGPNANRDEVWPGIAELYARAVNLFTCSRRNFSGLNHPRGLFAGWGNLQDAVRQKLIHIDLFLKGK
jgi:hypothetical protein